MEAGSLLGIALIIIGIFTFPESTAKKIERRIFRILRIFFRDNSQKDEIDQSGVVDIERIKKSLE